ncbi:MAG: UDP-N-acetylmuramoyl-L-alanine--D-glutamate ligase [Verrucomicrobiota bacterium]
MDWAGREVPVLGAGMSGKAAAALLRSQNARPILFDEKGREGAHLTFDPKAKEWQWGVVSPGFHPDHSWRKAARESGVELIAEIQLAASFWPGKLICITGTNGKTTLTQLLESALLANGERALACGNIGTPLSSIVEEGRNEDWAVCETSSFQLHDWVDPHPDFAFWTNFAEDHLDWHSSLAGYFKAKWKLVENAPVVYAPASLQETAYAFGVVLPKDIRWVSGSPSNGGGGQFARHPFSQLYGLAEAFWLDTGRDLAVLRAASDSFSPSAHRQEDLGVIDGVRFINDSKATNFHAVLASCEEADPPIYWIGGGLSKGGDLERFSGDLAKRCESGYVFGSIGPELGQKLEDAGLPVYVTGTLENAFSSALEDSRGGGTILLSPGFASFDQFAGYSERGDKFRELVDGLRTGSQS